MIIEIGTVLECGGVVEAIVDGMAHIVYSDGTACWYPVSELAQNDTCAVPGSTFSDYGK